MNRDRLVARIAENYDAAVAQLPSSMLSRHWRSKASAKAQLMRTHDYWQEFRRNGLSRFFDNSNPGSVEDDDADRVRLLALHAAVRSMLPADLHPYMYESQVGGPASLELSDGLISTSSLEFAVMLNSIRGCFAEGQVVIDLGGGYGGLARVIKQYCPTCTIVLLDLPEANACQAWFLANEFPNSDIRMFNDLDEDGSQSLTIDRPDFLIAPGNMIERFDRGSVALVINTRSMMEMQHRCVRDYLREIERVLDLGGHFYCVNRYQKLTTLKYYPFDTHWTVACSRPWPVWIDECPHHELLLKRAPTPSPDLRQALRRLPPARTLLRNRATYLVAQAVLDRLPDAAIRAVRRARGG